MTISYDEALIPQLRKIVHEKIIQVNKDVKRLEKDMRAKGFLSSSPDLIHLCKDLEIAKHEREALKKTYETLYDSKEVSLTDLASCVEKDLKVLPDSSSVRKFLYTNIFTPLEEFRQFFEDPDIILQNEKEVKAWKDVFLQGVEEQKENLVKILQVEKEKDFKNTYKIQQLKKIETVLDKYIKSVNAKDVEPSLIRINKQLEKDIQLISSKDLTVFSPTSGIKQFLQAQQENIQKQFPFLKNDKVLFEPVDEPISLDAKKLKL